MRSALAAVFVVGTGLFIGACSKPPDDPAAEDAAQIASPPSQAPTAWSRGTAASAAASAGPEANAGLAPINTVEPDALGELLAAAPKQAPKSTGDDGASLIGTETDAKEDTKRPKSGEPAPSAAPGADKAPHKKPLVTIGSLSLQGDMASPSIERAARAQLYWPLVQRCRDKQGKILPPDAVLILFRIDEDGYIIASSINATPSTPELEDAAHCMRRELSAATFRAPPAARGMTTAITMTAPSVD